MKKKKHMSYNQYLSKLLEWQFEKINKKLGEYDRKREQENNKK